MLREQDQGLLVTMSDPQVSFNVKPESDTKCNMFNMPVQDQLAELFKQEAVKQHIAQSVEQAGYLIPLNVVWNRLQEPLAVGAANDAIGFPEELRQRVIKYFLNGQGDPTNLTPTTTASPCRQASPFTFGGRTTQYPQVTQDPQPSNPYSILNP